MITSEQSFAMGCPPHSPCLVLTSAYEESVGTRLEQEKEALQQKMQNGAHPETQHCSAKPRKTLVTEALMGTLVQMSCQHGQK